MPSRLSDGPAATRSATGYLLAGGVPRKRVQEWMGHHDAGFTMAVYAQAVAATCPTSTPSPRKGRG
jgi:integrase